MQPNLDYLCRVCAANTRGRNSVGECVHIFKTHGLREKIERFLYLPVFDHDALPKVLCKTCFRQVDATASLSKIAKHTQKVFHDFLRCSAKPRPRASDAASTSAEGATEFTPVMFNDVRELDRVTQLAPAAVPSTSPPPLVAVAPAARKEEVVVNVSVTDPLTRETQEKMISASQKRLQDMRLDTRFAPKSIAQRAFITSPRQQEGAGNNSVSLLAAPLAEGVAKKVAPAALATGDSVAPSGSKKSSSPAGVINFIHGQPQQLTKLTGAGYVVGSVPKSTPAQGAASAASAATADESVVQQKRRNLKMTVNNIRATQTGQVSLLKVSQPKQQPQMPLPLGVSFPMPLPLSPEKTPPKPSSSNAHVKMSPRSAHSIHQKHQPLVAVDEVAAADNISDALQAAEDEELPQQIIIAAAKSKKRKQPRDTEINWEFEHARNRERQKLMRRQLPEKEEQEKESGSRDSSESSLSLTTPQQLVQLKTSAGIPDDIPLGKVIRDTDLLKLILKALKWPVTRASMEAQMQRLRNSKFTDIMSDAQLLQDTDLTQLLGPYLAPVLMAAQLLQQQQQQQQQAAPIPKAVIATKRPKPSEVTATDEKDAAAAIAAAAALVAASKASDLPASLLTSAIPYKLPPETSVQLIPASPPQQLEEAPPALPPLVVTGSSKRDAQPRTLPPKKMRKLAPAKVRQPSIVISDDDEDALPAAPAAPALNDSSSLAATPSSADVKSGNLHIDLDAAFMAQYSLALGMDGTNNEALLALLNRQRIAWNRQKERGQHRRQSSGAANLLQPDAELSFDADDIVLMDQQAYEQSSVAVADTPAPQQPPPQPPQSQPQDTAAASDVKPARRYSTTNTAPTSATQFQLPLALPLPLKTPLAPTAATHITRPIIKRRKTVIQASPVRTSVPNASVVAASGKAKPSEPTKATSATTEVGAVPLPLPLPPPPSPSSSTITSSATPIAKTTDTVTSSSATTTTSEPASTATTAASPADDPIAVESPPIPRATEVSLPTPPITTTTMCAVTPTPPPPDTAAAQVPSTTIASTTSPNDESALVATTPKSSCTTDTDTGTGTADSGVPIAVNLVPEATRTVKSYTKKPLTSKSALGQQLLEAIGLQKVASSTGSAAGERGGQVDSVQQIRSALKRQLKQAQEQKRQQELLSKAAKTQAAVRDSRPLPVIQDADSTTKSIVKDQLPPAELHTDIVDVEHELDKLNAAANREHDGQLADNEDDDEPLARCFGGARRKALMSSRMRRTDMAKQSAKDDKNGKAENGGSERSISVTTTLLVNDLSKQDTVVSVSSTDPAGDDMMDVAASSYNTNNPIRKSIRQRHERGGDSEDLDDGKQRRQTASRSRRDAGQPVRLVRERAAERTRGRLLAPVTVSNLRDSERDSDTGSTRNDRVYEHSRGGAADRDCEVNNRQDGYGSESTLNTVSGSRPTRVSKTLSKYYKEPDGRETTQRRSVPARNARTRR